MNAADEGGEEVGAVHTVIKETERSKKSNARKAGWTDRKSGWKTDVVDCYWIAG